MKKRVFTLFIVLSMLCGCSSLKNSSQDFFAMDTFMNISVWSSSKSDADTILSNAQKKVNELSNRLSRQISSSSIAKLNSANGEPVTLDDDAYNALKQAVELAKFTNGAFDPTTAVLSDLWGIGTDSPSVPNDEQINETLTHVGYENIVFLEDNQVKLLNGAQVDLGGIGKGYVTDLVTKDISTPILASLGGNIGAYGENPNSDNGLWSIGLADPDNNSSYIASIKIKDLSIVTSGDYERYFEQDGVRYHHIFDPKTGYPAQNELRAVTVIDRNSTRADALTTALFVMGLDEGIKFCKDNDINAVFITKEHKIYTVGSINLTLAEGADYEIIKNS
ncbi:MAG TPA: FAD:protein FMN transferase [Candidatus Butyricicoccus avistercoris]|uniref:FAD:protein FMN transferase n=1 Tax=Candidatus Butyricicoccus avistercoris TaxID=2838518 RepID=A0A9D1PGP6_9FIRM|nr:FAD:protein FMN transferase [Candidatus Butyricicoccus avistercoris]